MSSRPDIYEKLHQTLAERGDLIAMIVGFALLSRALKTISVGTGHAVWTGIGATDTALVGIVFLGELREMLRIDCLVLMVTGVVGLKFVSAAGR